MKKERFVISTIVNNESGVLTRVSGLFARRGFNIDSLSVGETENSEFSRITITATVEDYIKEQIIRQLEKLHDVKKVELMDRGKTVLRELLLVKVKADPNKRSEIFEAVNVFRAKVVDMSPDSLIIEITGETAKVNAFIEYISSFGITELCRTGITAMGRGEYILKDKKTEEEN